MKNQYDIFISYRRTAYDTANLIAEKLRHAGYRVFFDIDTLTSGKFNEQLLEVIKGCKDFILVLPKNALERCSDENDWIRREVTCAIEHKKNIIPVMLTGFAWPAEMPKGMEDLPNYQAIAAINREFFDMAVTRLKGYLKSKPSLPLKSWLIKASIVLFVLLAFVGVGFGIVHHIANVTCEDIANKMSNTMIAADAIGDIHNELSEQSSSFFYAMEHSNDEDEQKVLESDMMKELKKIEKDIQYYKTTFPAPIFRFEGIDNYVINHYNVKLEELQAFSAFYFSFYDDLEEITETLKEMVSMHEYPREYKDMVTRDLTCMSYSINAFYYGYLEILSLIPKSARKTHYELAKDWRNFPNGTPLDLSQEEYQQFQEYEVHKVEKIITEYGSKVNFEEYKWDDIEKQIEELTEAIEKY